MTPAAALLIVGLATSPSFAEAPGSPRADLVILEVQVLAARPETLRVRVANQGTLTAAETRLEVRYARGGKVLTTFSVVPRLQSGERQWLLIYADQPLDRVESAVLRIDEPSRIDESDEENNVFVLK